MYVHGYDTETYSDSIVTIINLLQWNMFIKKICKIQHQLNIGNYNVAVYIPYSGKVWRGEVW